MVDRSPGDFDPTLQRTFGHLSPQTTTLPWTRMVLFDGGRLFLSELECKIQSKYTHKLVQFARPPPTVRHEFCVGGRDWSLVGRGGTDDELLPRVGSLFVVVGELVLLLLLSYASLSFVSSKSSSCLEKWSLS